MVRPALVLSFIALACSHRPEPAAPASAPPPTVSVPRTVVTPEEATSIPELFERARADFAKEDYPLAARGFDRVLELEPEGRYAAAALFNAGWAYDNAGRNEEALRRYEELSRRFPADENARTAVVRAIRIACYLEQWEKAGVLSDRVLARADELGPLEQVVAYSGRGLALVAAGDPDGAAHFVEKGRAAVERFRLDSAGTVPRDLAQLYYALGEIRRLRGERIVFDPPPKDFAAELERRCQLLLDAQSAYSDTMRAYDAHWSAMAGFRVGELYKELHVEIMKMPPPAVADTDARRALFEGAMRLRYSVLLQKGRAMMEHTVDMATRTREQSEWVTRAREALRELDTALKQENAAIDALPYSRADLQRALDDLARRKEASKAQAGGR